MLKTYPTLVHEVFHDLKGKFFGCQKSYGNTSRLKNFYTDFFFSVTVPSPWRYPNKNLLQYDQRPTYMILWKQGNFCKSKLLWVHKFIFEIYFSSSWQSIKNVLQIEYIYWVAKLKPILENKCEPMSFIPQIISFYE